MTVTHLDITQDHIRRAIIDYLEQELLLETMKAFKDKKPTQAAIDSKKAKLKADFDYHVWLQMLNDALETMQSQVLSLATHTSKGIHSAVRSDNVLLTAPTGLPENFVSSNCVINPKLDANTNNTGGHAGHLKFIVGFLNIMIANQRFYLLIQSHHQAMQDFFGQELSVDNFNYLAKLLNTKITTPITDARNKQTLFPISEDNYHCLIPLYPSALAHHLHQKVNTIKYSDAAKSARKARFSKEKEGADVTGYQDILDLAVVKLGGENAQNVSRLNNIQGGFHYLLPSMPPPMLEQKRSFTLSRSAQSFFGSNLEFSARKALAQVFAAVNHQRNIVEVRQARKQAMDEVLHQVFFAAETLRNGLPAGWSKQYAIHEEEKLWLDPHRAALDGEEDFKARREQDDSWHEQIIHHFALWINNLLKAEFTQQKYDFGDAEHLEWQREITEMKKRYERAGKGVFL